VLSIVDHVQLDDCEVDVVASQAAILDFSIWCGCND